MKIIKSIFFHTQGSRLEVARFFAVAMVGLVLDIGVAWSSVHLLGAPLWLAAAVGFTFAAVGNYVLHEAWTFRQEEAPVLSSKRALFYLIGSSVTLLSRLAVVAWLATWISRDHALEILIGGAAVSFFVNYVISKLLVFPKCSEKGNNF